MLFKMPTCSPSNDKSIFGGGRRGSADGLWRYAFARISLRQHRRSPDNLLLMATLPFARSRQRRYGRELCRECRVGAEL